MNYTEPSKTERTPKVKRVIRIDPLLRRKTIIYRNKSIKNEHKMIKQEVLMLSLLI